MGIINKDGKRQVRKSLLDLVFSNKDVTVKVHDRLTSDHKMILVKSNIKTVTIERSKVSRRNWKKYSPEKLMEHFNQQEPTLEPRPGSDLLNETLVIKINDSLDQICPYRVLRTSRQTDLLDHALEAMKKKRKRLRKSYNLSRNDVIASKIEHLNRRIKVRISDVKKQQIRTRLDGDNPKSFWKFVSDLEGSEKLEDIELDVNGTIVNNDDDLCEIFADHFSNKVNMLSNSYVPNSFSKPKDITPLTFSLQEISSAASTLKSKLCSGENGLPMKVIRDLGVSFPELFLELFNSAATSGMPAAWKTAIVTPLHKKGDKKSASQYRPISNLCSLSKLFEKIILLRLNALGELDGRFQHGFKSNRSTTTAMLEIQDFVSDELDRNNTVGMYSIDLTAAFDLLRPDCFYDIMKDKIDSNILCVLMDFLSGRNFKVKMGTAQSRPKDLMIGCVTGINSRSQAIYIVHITNTLSPT